MNTRLLKIELCSQCKYYLANFQGDPYCFKCIDPMHNDPLGKLPPDCSVIPTNCPLPKC